MGYLERAEQLKDYLKKKQAKGTKPVKAGDVKYRLLILLVCKGCQNLLCRSSSSGKGGKETDSSDEDDAEKKKLKEQISGTL